MTHIDGEFVHKHFDYNEFVVFLKEQLTHEISIPERQHYEIANNNLLTMPAWQAGNYIGVKLVTVFPDSTPSIHGVYVLFDGRNGEVLCTIDGLSLTVKRTSAVSALASDFLSSPDSHSLLMMGTGNLCCELVKAHMAVRPISQVWIWGRNMEKARSKAASLEMLEAEVKVASDLSACMPSASIISCATMAEDPIIFGQNISNDAHIDLVGSFKKNTREADNDCLYNRDIFVDTYTALKESGDLYLPMQENVITRNDIKCDLTALCKNEYQFSRTKNRGTYFKSVGFAGPDLAAAIYLYHKL